MTYPDLLIHLSTGLGGEAGQQLAEWIKTKKGVVEARFNPRKEHLLQVWYDPQVVPAEGVLDLVTNDGREAKVVAL